MNERQGLIGYFAHNPVAANLLMLMMIVMGLFAWSDIQRQVFSTAEDNRISIFVHWPGASPQEVEQNITLKIEQALKGMTALGNVYSDTGNTYTYFNLEIKQNEPLEAVLNEVKRKLDTISTFPGNMEPPVVDKFHWNQNLMRVVIQGLTSQQQLKQLGQQVENELLQLQNVELVEFSALPNYEIAIEIDPMVLRRYSTDLAAVAENIQQHSANVSAGAIRMDAGELQIRLDQQSFNAAEFGEIPVIVGAQGQKILLKDVADVVDGLADQQKFTRFNGQLATSIHVQAAAHQSMPLIADSLYKYIDQKNQSLPDGVWLSAFADDTRYLTERIDMMLSNLLQGAILVFLVLMVFLRTQVAFWVMVGVPVVLLATVFMMPFFNISINVTTLFAFIMALGIVVDDAIVIGESAYSECEAKGHSVANVVSGTRRVGKPVTFGVLTTMAVFMPLLFATGSDSGQFIDLSAVVILCLLFSLVESKLILPAHLAQKAWKPLPDNHWRLKVDAKLNAFIQLKYQPFLLSCINNRWLTLSAFVGVLLVSVSLITANWLQVVYLPKVAADTAIIRVNMNSNVSRAQTVEIIDKIEGIVRASDEQILQSHGHAVVENVLTIVPNRAQGEIHVAFVNEAHRPVDAFELSRLWYEPMLALTGVKSIEIQDEALPSGQGAGVGYRFYGQDLEKLNSAALQLSQQIAGIEGVYNVGSSVDPQIKELSFELKPRAYALGLTAVSIANQVNVGFYGFEVDRIARDGNDIRVLVRYPQSLRQQKSALKYSVIITPSGDKVMLGDVVDIVEKQGVNSIRREKGFRSVVVWAGVDENLTTSDAVMGVIGEQIMPAVLAEHPEVKTELSGAIVELQNQRDEMLMFGLMALLLVYVLLAIPLKSYVKPALVMLVIPFSLIGATWGHFIFGLQFSLFSIFGLIAAIGVVINDSLVLLDAIERAKDKGIEISQALMSAAASRFRAIMITSVTTFVGLVPIMLETSVQGKYIAPMAVSLAFALLVSTLTTLLFLPTVYLMVSRRRLQQKSNFADKPIEA